MTFPSSNPERPAGFSRREFLAWGAAGGVTGAASLFLGRGFFGFVQPDGGGLAPVHKDETAFPAYDHEIKTTCLLCPVGCGIIACVRGSDLVMVKGNPDHPVNQGRICIRCLAGLNGASDPERLARPVRRKGSRGKGSWTPVSWKEALEEIAGRIGKLGEGDPSNDIVVEDRFPIIDRGLVDRMLSRLGLMKHYARFPSGGRLEADDLRMTWPSRRTADFRTANTVLNFSGELLDGELGPRETESVVDMVFCRGGTLLTFDARLTRTASRSRTWIPVEPGLEPAVLLAIARVYLDRVLADGIKAKAVDFHKELTAFAPWDVERRAGLSKGTLTEAGHLLHRSGPSAVFGGKALWASPKADEAVRALYFLNDLLLQHGNARAFTSPPSVKRPSVLDIPERLTSQGAGIFMAMGADPAGNWPGSQGVIKTLTDESKVGFSVAFQTHWTRTARLADLVLPAAGPFEVWGLTGGPKAVSLVRPCSLIRGEYAALRAARSRGQRFTDVRNLAAPPGRALSREDFLIRLARTLSPQGDLPTGDFQDLLWTTLERSMPRERREAFSERGFFPLDAPAGAGEKKETDSVVYLGTPELPPAKEREKDRFTLVSLPTPLSLSYLSNSKWLREMEHDNPLIMNRSAGKALGLTTGDNVRVSSDGGKVETEVRLIEGIHPGVVALKPGFGSAADTHMARGESRKTDDPDTGLVWWETGPAANIYEVIAPVRTGFGDGYARTGTEVRVEKILA